MMTNSEYLIEKAAINHAICIKQKLISSLQKIRSFEAVDAVKNEISGLECQLLMLELKKAHL